MKERAKYLLSPWFIGSLSLLICNDFWWKAAYSNALTGKLSDFSGVLVLGLLFNFLSDGNRKLNALFVIVFFTFWKSPLSEGLIVTWNSHVPFPLERVVDYSDLLAFVMIPVVSHVRFPERSFQKIPLVAILCVSLFALASTSRARNFGQYPFVREQQIFTLRIKQTQEAFLDQIKREFSLSVQRKDSLELDGIRMESYSLAFKEDAEKARIDSMEFTFFKVSKNIVNVNVISIYLNPDLSMSDWSTMEAFKKRYHVKRSYFWNAVVNRPE